MAPDDGTATATDTVALLRNLHEGERAIPHVIAFGDAVVPALEFLLRGPSQTVPHSRCWAADALAGIGSKAAIEALVRALEDAGTRRLAPAPREPEAVVIGRIVEHLGIVPGAEISDALLEALRRHPASPSCVQAAGARLDERGLPLLASCLFEDASRTAAVHALWDYGSRAIPTVLGAATAPTIDVAAESFIHVEGRRAAVELLGRYLTADASLAAEHVGLAHASLARALEDSQHTVRLAAAIALSRADMAQPEAVVEILTSALEDATWPLLESVMAAIRSLGPRVAAALSRVIADSGARGPRRLRAILLAGRMKATRTAPLLATLATDADESVRLEAARALARMRPGIDSRFVARFLQDPVACIRRTAFSAACRAHALDLDSILSFLADPDRHIRRVARFILRGHPDRAMPLLVRALRSGGRPARGLRSRWRLWQQACVLVTDMRLTPDERRKCRLSFARDKTSSDG